MASARPQQRKRNITCVLLLFFGFASLMLSYPYSIEPVMVQTSIDGNASTIPFQAQQPTRAEVAIGYASLDFTHNTFWKTELLQHYAFALLTTEKFHHRLQWALKSWWVPEYNSIVEAYSDSTNTSEIDFEIPNLVDTHCPDSYNFGLWCKNDFLFERWATDPKYKNVKWFYRGMDDSGIHMENLVWLAQQYDYRKPVVIGERICLNDDYPDGGPGFLISRGLIDSPTLRTSWNKTLTSGIPMLDDFLWGRLITLEKAAFYHSNGVSHEPYTNSSELYRYYLRQRGHPWPLNYRPTLYHQAKDTIELMPIVHRDLLGIDFSNMETRVLFTPPHCICWGHLHHRCSWSLDILLINGTRTICSFPNPYLECTLGPTPPPNPLPEVRGVLAEIKATKDQADKERLAKEAAKKAAEEAAKLAEEAARKAAAQNTHSPA